MSIYSVVLILSLIVFSTLLIGVLRDTRTKIRRRFAVYVVTAMAWSLSALVFSLLVFSLDDLQFSRALAGVAAVSGVCTVIAYYDFVRVFVHRTSNIEVKLGYAAVALILVPLVALGYMPESVTMSNGAVDIKYGLFLYPITVIGAIFFLLSVFVLMRKYRSLTDPLGRNRIAYLLGGLGLLMVFSLRSSIPPFPRYPFEHIGHLANALVISYAIMKYKLLDIKFLIRKGLVYSLISIFVTASFLLVLFGVHYFLQGWNTSANLAAIFAIGSCICTLDRSRSSSFAGLVEVRTISPKS